MEIKIAKNSGADTESIKEISPKANISEEKGFFRVVIHEEADVALTRSAFQEKFGTVHVWQ